MNKVTTPELQIHRISAMAAHVDGSRIVVKAQGLLEQERTDLEIAVTTDLAPSIALALLSTTAKARAQRDELGPALDVLGAAVVRSSSEDSVRLQLIFDGGAVLPFELSLEASRALSNGLLEYLESSQRRLADRQRAVDRM